MTGVDPAGVRIYRGPLAERVTATQNADALTDGGANALSAGHATDTPETLGLLAHELTHVAQRRAPRFVPPIAQAPQLQSQPAMSPTDEESQAGWVEARVTNIARTRSAAPIAAQQPTSGTVGARQTISRMSALNGITARHLGRSARAVGAAASMADQCRQYATTHVIVRARASATISAATTGPISVHDHSRRHHQMFLVRSAPSVAVRCPTPKARRATRRLRTRATCRSLTWTRWRSKFTRSSNGGWRRSDGALANVRGVGGSIQTCE